MTLPGAAVADFLQPQSNPGEAHDVLDGKAGVIEVIVTAAELLVGRIAAIVVVYVVTSVSLHPKKPGEIHVVDVTTLTLVFVLVEEADDDVEPSSSRQPHQPGVLQIDVLVVRVYDELVVDEVFLPVVELLLAEELLLKYFQLKQFASGQSTTGSQVATLS